MSFAPSLLLVASLALAAAAPVAAEEASGAATAGSMMIENGFARATLPGARTGGAYLTLMNHGGEPDRLVSLASPVAEKASVHEMAMKGDVMQMRALADGLSIAAGETVTLAPGGLHLMLEGLKQPLTEGSSVPVTLTFEKAGAVEVALPVLGRAAKGPALSADHAMPGMDHSAN